MSLTRSRRKPHKSRREPARRVSRVLEEIKNQRYLAFVRAIVGASASGHRS
jgi:hypothetical protein